MIIRSARLFAVVVLVAVAWGPGTLARQEMALTGRHVAYIAEKFLGNHYSRVGFDDTHSARMLERYINLFDPAHAYFLGADVAEFRRYRHQLDDLIADGNIEIAFRIFDRYKVRLAARTEVIQRLLNGPFDLKSDDEALIDRKEAPFPANLQSAEAIWAKRLKFELLEMVTSGTGEKEAREILRTRYRSSRKRVDQYAHNDIVAAFLNAFTHSYDPHSAYLSPDELENFNIALRLSLEGIGATLRWEDGYTVISSVIPGGAAAREGTLRLEDKIIAVAQGADGAFEDVRDQRLIDVVKLIRGRRGTVVRLAFQRKNKDLVAVRHEVSIVRDRITLKEGEATGEVQQRRRAGKAAPYRVGVIKLPSFYVDFSKRRSQPESYKSSSRDVEAILRQFREKAVAGVVLDLRNNGGGGLDEAVSLAGLFLNRGPIVMVKNLSGRVEIHSNPHNKPLFRGPLVIMVNRFSASASEIVAGVMKDYGRAVLVGDRATFGKGTVQNILPISRTLGALKTTVAKFYRPGSSSTQNRGVAADIVLPSLNNHLEIGEASLDNALPWDAIPGVTTFDIWGDLSPFLPLLTERSRRRLADLPFFRKVEEGVQTYLKTQKGRKTVTVKRILEARRDNGKVESEKGEEKKPGHQAAAMDQYTEEAIEIMVDLIQFQNKETPQGLASLKK